MASLGNGGTGPCIDGPMASCRRGAWLAGHTSGSLRDALTRLARMRRFRCQAGDGLAIRRRRACEQCQRPDGSMAPMACHSNSTSGMSARDADTGRHACDRLAMRRHAALRRWRQCRIGWACPRRAGAGMADAPQTGRRRAMPRAGMARGTVPAMAGDDPDDRQAVGGKEAHGWATA